MSAAGSQPPPTGYLKRSRRSGQDQPSRRAAERSGRGHASSPPQLPSANRGQARGGQGPPPRDLCSDRSEACPSSSLPTAYQTAASGSAQTPPCIRPRPIRPWTSWLDCWAPAGVRRSLRWRWEHAQAFCAPDARSPASPSSVSTLDTYTLKISAHRHCPTRPHRRDPSETRARRAIAPKAGRLRNTHLNRYTCRWAGPGHTWALYSISLTHEHTH